MALKKLNARKEGQNETQRRAVVVVVAAAAQYRRGEHHLLKSGSFRWLSHPLVLLEGHGTPQLLQHRFNRVVPLPAVEHTQAALLHTTIALTDANHLDLGNELDTRGFIRVLGSTLHTQAVDPVLIRSPWWANDHASPVSQRHVAVVLKAPANGAIANTFLALLQLF